jgi:N-acetylmuramoyl-L-alanine amidase
MVMLTDRHKKIIFILTLILFSINTSGQEIYTLKLRSSLHPEFLRIVLEGKETVISKAIVNQSGNDIIVRFPDTRFNLQVSRQTVRYKQHGDSITFSPGRFNKLKVFTLKFPSRLVIDAFLIKEGFQRDIKEKHPSKGRIRKVRTITTFVIDPGHGGYDIGISNESFLEKNTTLNIAKKLKALIDRGKGTCYLTRQSDQYMTINERVNFTNNMNAEVFISLHIGNHSEIVIYTPVATYSGDRYSDKYLANTGSVNFIKDTQILRDSIQNAITENFGEKMVIIKPLPYSILSNIEAASLLIELPSFNNIYYIPEMETEIANTLYKGLYFYEEKTAR